MQVLGFILFLLLDVRAHIPNQPSFGPVRPDHILQIASGTRGHGFSDHRGLLSDVLWLAVRFAIGFL